ncbi:MAG: efflux RND transporter periplasmic adaptor subunit [Nitratireductor sp.]
MLDKSKSSKDLKVANTTDASAAGAAANVSNATPISTSTKIAFLAFRAILQLALMVGILGGAFFIMNKMIDSKPKKAERPIFPRVYTVETIKAVTADHQPKIVLYGEIVAGRSVDLRSFVGGQVTSISDKLKSGGMVEKGDPLVEIDRFTFEGNLLEARANEAETKARMAENEARIKLEKSRLLSAKDQLELAKKDRDRFVELRNRKTATAKQLEDKEFTYSQRAQAVEQSEINIIAEEAKLAQLDATLQRLQWRIAQSERNLNDTVLTAPFTGTILSSTVQAGKLVSANDVLISMYQSDLLDARFVLTDEQFGRLQADKDGLVNRAAQIKWVVGGKQYNFDAKIDRIGAEIASARGGIEVFATIVPNKEGPELRPGAFVEINLPDKTFEKHIKLPDTAIYNGDTVYIVEKKKLVGKTVDIVAYDGEEAIIASGIANADEVLTTRISAVSDGLRIRKEGDPIRQRGNRGANGQRGERGTQDGAKGGKPNSGDATNSREANGKRPNGQKGERGKRPNGQQGQRPQNNQQ